VENPNTATVYVTSVDIGKQNSTGNHILYTDGANQTIPGRHDVFWNPSSGSYWVTDIPDGSCPRCDGQAFANIHLAIAGHPYEVITEYDTP